jgi:hypothetical protein
MREAWMEPALVAEQLLAAQASRCASEHGRMSDFTLPAEESETLAPPPVIHVRRSRFDAACDFTPLSHRPSSALRVFKWPRSP